MRIVTLSDHAGEQAERARQARETLHEQGLAIWRAATTAREERISKCRGALRQSWQARRWLALVPDLGRWVGATLSGKPVQPIAAVPGEEEARWTAGQEGERWAEQVLSTVLDDQWVAFKGYVNRGGEVDLVVVGPTAIAAIEVKAINGVVHCVGNDWRRDKSDRWGNVVERGRPIRDKGGRAPNEQVNASADGLATFLESRGQAVHVRRVVLLAHRASRLGKVDKPGVDFIGPVADPEFPRRFWRWLRDTPDRLNVKVLEDLVRRDHEFHARRRRAGAMASVEEPAAGGGKAAAATPATVARPALPQLVPPTADIVRDLSALERRQVDTLRRDIAALHASQGRDMALEQRVRIAISGYLNSGARWSVLSAAACACDDPSHRQLLDHLINQCRQTVELADRTLTAIVAPVAVRWALDAKRATAGGDLALEQAQQMSLDSAASMIKFHTEAQAVRFSRRIYGDSLRYVDARTLRDAMLEIEAGHDPTCAELKPVTVRPETHGDWRVVYLLGVAVTPPGEQLDIDDEEMQRALVQQEAGFEGALTMSATILARNHNALQAHGEGIWTLEAGVLHGEYLALRHRLERTLVQSRPERAGLLRCWYAEDPTVPCIRLLVSWGDGRAENGLSMPPGVNGLDRFRNALDEAIAARVPPGTDVQIDEADLYDYQRAVRAQGMSWVGQPARRSA